MPVKQVLFDLERCFDLHAYLVWQGNEPHRGASVASGVAKNLNQQIRAAIDDLGLTAKIRGAVDHAQHLDGSLDAIEIAIQRLPCGSENLEPYTARGKIGIFGADIGADLPLRSVIGGTSPGDEQQVSGPQVAHIVGGGVYRRRQLESQFVQSFFDMHETFPFRDHGLIVTMAISIQTGWSTVQSSVSARHRWWRLSLIHIS